MRARFRFSPRRLSLAAAAVCTAGTALALAIEPAGFVGSADRAAAAIPGADAAHAVVQVYVGGVRTNATVIGPLAGVKFGLFKSNPTASIDANNGFATATPDYTCTSDAQGDCSFVVPIGSGAGAVPGGTQLWAAATGAPGLDYYANPYWQTAPLSGGVRASLRHVFRTPALVANQVYRAGSNWIGDPGINDPAAAAAAGVSAADYQRRVASGGVTPLSRVDNELPNQCGLKVALDVDLSSSVQGHVPALKSAMNSFVDALRGTPSQASLFTFGTDSPANGYGANSSLMSVATTADANKFKALYTGWSNTVPTNYTNWDRGLDAVADANSSDLASANHVDLVVFITDGNPTVYGPDPLNARGQLKDPNSGYTRFRELGNAVASANLVKSQGTKILAVGIGDGVAGQGAAYNLRSVSGTQAYNGSNIHTADYIQSTDYAAAATALRNVVLDSCAPSISVVKRIIPDGGTIADAYTPVNGWDFSASTTTAGATISPATATTNPQTGATNFDVTLTGAGSGDFAVQEAQQAGYTLYGTNADGTAGGTQNAGCVDKSSGTDVPVPVTNQGADGFSLPVGIQGVISCVVYNQAPDFTQASVVVHKQWRIVTDAGVQEVSEGAQPAGLQATLSLDGPDHAAATSQPWDVVRDGYHVATDSPVTVAEDVSSDLPGCTESSATLTGTGIPADDPIVLDPDNPTASRVLAAGENDWTLTNTVVCRSYLTVAKTVASGTGNPAWWSLHAIGPGSALPGPGGISGTSAVTHVEVTPDVLYQLAEDRVATAPHEAIHYVQNDQRTRPLQYPQSTGSWACTVRTGGSSGAPDPSVATEGAIYVPLGMDLVCTAVNQTATLTVVKHVDGGPAQPSDFTFTATPIAPVVPGGDAHRIPGAPAPGSTITVVPGQRYALTEQARDDPYQLTDLSCTSAGTVLPVQDLVLLPGASATCEATNTYSTWAASKTSDPASGKQVNPGDLITYTIHAHQIQGAPTHDVVITDDLSGVLGHAALQAETITASAGSAAHHGSTLTWTIPRLEGSQTLTYQVRVNSDAWDATLRNTLTEVTTAPPPDAPGDHDPPQPCDNARSGSVSVAAACDTTTNTTPEEAADQDLNGSLGHGASMPNTGGPAWWWLLVALGAIATGSGLLVAARRRRQM